MSESVKSEKPSRSQAKLAKTMAGVMMNPAAAHGTSATTLLRSIAGGHLDKNELSVGLVKRMMDVRRGKLDSVNDLLVAQAFSLDALYIDLMRRACANMGHSLDVVDRYLRLALKAQAQSRATLEALAKMHQPREQTVRHVHVDNRGGQAVIADNVQTGGPQNGKSDEQSHATGAAGIGSALPGPNPIGWTMPVTGSQGPEEVSDARRDQSGGA